MHFRSLISKLSKRFRKPTKATATMSAQTPNTNNAADNATKNAAADTTALSTPEARRILHERNEKFAADQQQLMDRVAGTMDEVQTNNRDLVNQIMELRAENERLRRENGKLLMLAEMREEDKGEHFDAGEHLGKMVAKHL